jgi:hypothetical protein
MNKNQQFNNHQIKKRFIYYKAGSKKKGNNVEVLLYRTGATVEINGLTYFVYQHFPIKGSKYSREFGSIRTEQDYQSQMRDENVPVYSQSEIMEILSQIGEEDERKSKAQLLRTSDPSIINPEDALRYTQEFKPEIVVETEEEENIDETKQQAKVIPLNRKTVETKPSTETINIIPLQNNFTRDSVKKDSDYLYLFTDNAERASGPNNVDLNSWYVKKYQNSKRLITYPSKTQAVIRGLSNAFPITTMVDDKKTQWKDSQFEEYKKIIDDEINTIKIELANYKGIKFGGQMPFGKGQISDMKNSAPKIWNYLNQKLAEIGIDNTGEKPVVISEKGEIIEPKSSELDNNSFTYEEEYIPEEEQFIPSEEDEKQLDIIRKALMKDVEYKNSIAPDNLPEIDPDCL